jgi:Zn-dependent protease
MEENEFSQRQYDPHGQPIQPTFWQKVKKFLAPVGVGFVVFFKYLAKLKFLLPVLKTGGSMVFMIWVYAMFWGVWFAVGFVLLIFVHECGHLIAAKRIGLKVGAPVFIPFMGALIALKEAPRNAWIESQVGIGGPLLGTVGAVACELIYLATGNLMFRSLAYTGFFLNLFNLMPVGPLDGGRIITALSPWLWIVGFAILVFLTITHFNFILLLIIVFSLPRLFFLFRKKSEIELRYFEVTPAQRWIMAVLYFGLITFLVIGMQMTKIPYEFFQKE